MTLQHINIDHLTVSPLNVRKHGAKDVGDLTISIRALGMLQPLLVRQTGEDSFEVIAGQRRLHACRALAEEGEAVDIPCLIMGEGDDAKAIEASLAENIERLPMDEVDQFKAFAKLTKEGRCVEDIAATFGLTERLVTQRLALGRLYAPILTAYRKGDIHARDARSLTMATPKQQKTWWALVKDEEAFIPTGHRLKDWLFGGAHIPTTNAIFDVEASGLAVVSDLFGEEAYFADSEAFWAHQNEAIQMIAKGYEVSGWQDVIVMERGAYFATWEHRPCAMEDGGKVFITVSHQGEVAEHEGFITNAEASRREKAASGDTAAEKLELTKPAQNYIDLHRHAAIRADLLKESGTALRLIAAHMICGSDLWGVNVERQKAAKPEIAESLAANSGQQAMDAEREAIQTLLAIPEGSYCYRPSITQVFGVLQALSDADITRVLTFLMAETLSVQSPLIDMLGETLETDMHAHWRPDETFLTLVRDKQVLNAMVADYAGEDVAAANVSETAKTQRSILSACLNGTRTPANADWTPRYMAFPQGSYRVAHDAQTPEPEQMDITAIAAE